MRYFHVKKEAYAEIEVKFSCAHEHREIRHRIIKDGRDSFVFQCVRCGHTSSPIKVKDAQAQSATKPIQKYDDLLSERWRNAKRMEYQKAFFRLKPELKREYEEYLHSDLWKEIRKNVIARTKGLCEICNEDLVEEVHHMTYKRIGSESLEDLLGVCSACHKIIHKICST
ncbi:MAG: hypothetical protein LM522_14595 [Candidatus Contendobacter sp.]|nr:hypothetical protein [Candidatus Contendobacter sp.]